MILDAIAEEFNCSRSLLYRWLNMESERKEAWREAKRLSADALVEQAGELLDSAEEIVGITSAKVSLRRERAAYRRWLASVRNREEYGESPSSVNVAVSLGDLHMQALLAGGGYASQKREPELLEAEVE